jgi:small-conductance mechanosensitive channel
MAFSEVMSSIRELLALELFPLSGTPVTVATVLTVVFILVATLWGSRLLRRALEVWFRRRGVTSAGTVNAVARLLHYVVVFLGFGAALETLGVNLGALFAAGAVFAVGIGFAMQTIAQNFVSGVILLAERAIKPGDILHLDDQIVRVDKLGIRSTIVETRDGYDLIVPNSTIVQSTVTNFTLTNSQYRIRVPVGVTYGSDMNRVRETLEEVAAEFGKKIPIAGRKPQVVLVDFGNSSVDFDIAVWIDDPWQERIYVSDLRFAIWNAFKSQGIVIAFPQLDVHFDRPVHEGFARLAEAR